MACSREMASRTTVRLTPSCVMRLLSVGSLSPGLSAREAICSLMKLTTCSARLRLRAAMGVASDSAMWLSLARYAFMVALYVVGQPHGGPTQASFARWHCPYRTDR